MIQDNKNSAPTPEKLGLDVTGKMDATESSGWQWARAGRRKWRVNDRFLTPDLIRHLAEPQRLFAAATLLKDKRQASGTLVVRLDLPEFPARSFVLKQYRPRSVFYGLKDFFRPSRAQQAFEHAFRLQRLGIQTALPVAATQNRFLGWPNEGYLLTTFVSDAVTLQDFDKAGIDHSNRRAMIRSLARLLATLHNAGLSHADPGLTNFMVVQKSAGAPALVLIDLDGVRQSGPLHSRTQLRDLRQFLKHSAVTSREHRWFLAQYCRSRAIQMVAHDLARTIRRDSAVFFSGHGPNREFGTEFSGGFLWDVRRPKLTPQVELILRAPDKFLVQAKVLKPSRSSAVSAAGGIVLKRYNYRNWTSRFKGWFRQSRGRRCFQNAYLLEIAGIRTAAPIAATEVRCRGFIVRSYFVMAEIPGAVSLQFWNGNKREAAEKVARLLAKLHREGFAHRDLKEGNIVLDCDGQPHLIDLDGLCCARKISHERAADNLARLARDAEGWHWQLSRTGRARFIKAYCRARRLEDWRWWWRAIEKRNGR